MPPSVQAYEWPHCSHYVRPAECLFLPAEWLSRDLAVSGIGTTRGLEPLNEFLARACSMATEAACRNLLEQFRWPNVCVA